MRQSQLSLPLNQTTINKTPDDLQGVGVKVRAAATWVAAAMFLTQVVGLARSVFTARLLTPDDFGLASMVTTVVAALGALTIVSLDQGILPGHAHNRDEDIRRRLDVTWTAELIRGIATTLLIVAVAYPTARFYGRGELALLI